MTAPVHQQSTAILHSSNNAYREELLTKIGGQQVLHAAVDDFYSRLVKDPKLQPFFRHANMAVLKWHQFNIMSIAFAHKPENLDVEQLILSRHVKLFDQGLSEEHFDIMMKYFDETFCNLQVDPHIVQEAKDVVLPIRSAFVKGAQDATARAHQADVRRHLWLGSVIGLVAVASFLTSSKQKSK